MVQVPHGAHDSQGEPGDDARSGGHDPGAAGHDEGRRDRREERRDRHAGRRNRHDDTAGRTRSGEPGGAGSGHGDPPSGGGPRSPRGSVYEWYTRGMRLLKEGSPAAAAEVLEHAAEAEPDSRSVREALARAQFEARRYAAAAHSFRRIVEANPAEDYAYFGLGMALWRMGDLAAAAEQLSIATAMCPDNSDYARALRGVRAGLERRTA